MRRDHPCLPAVLVLALAGCASDGETSLTLGAGQLRAIFAGEPSRERGADPEAVAAALAVVAREATEPLLHARLEQRGLAATLERRARNGAVATWETADGVALNLEEGVLRSTRGLAGDLLVAETGRTLQGLGAASSEPYTRRYRHLDAENRVETRELACRLERGAGETISIAERDIRVRRVTERCTLDGREIANTYWLAAESGEIVQSRQWVGPAIGHVFLQRIVA